MHNQKMRNQERSSCKEIIRQVWFERNLKIYCQM
jgi:hypothetical protein